jgi:hypothetical protein
MQRKTRVAGAFVAALALAAAAACSDDTKGGEDGAPEGAGETFEAPRLIDMVNESNRLLFELQSAESRIVKGCLEEDGFTVHDEVFFVSGEFEPEDELVRADDWGSWLPSVEEASQYGFGMWRSDPEADPDEVEEYMAYKGFEIDSEAMGGGSEGGGTESEFAALDPQEQFDWYVAYQGEAAALDEYGYLVGEEGAEPEASEDEIYTGDEFSYMQPEPGGCLREMIDALYDDLRLVEDPEGGKIRGAYWYYRPDNPMDDGEAMEASQVMFHEGLAAVQSELVDCLAEHDRHGWEFDEESSLPVTDYFYELYEGEGTVVGDFPDLPDDAPDDYEGKKAFEIAFAVDLAECGDETGYRETAEESWVASQESFYVSIETATYAWQEEVKAILAEAQEVLER